MRGVELKLLLALVLVLLGATVIVGFNLGDDAAAITLQSQTRPLRANVEEKALTSVRPSVSYSSRPHAEIAARSGASVIDLVCVLRC